MPNLLDIIKANQSDREVGLIDESMRVHPEMTIGDNARTIDGVQYKTLVRTALGNTSGSFRGANQGGAPPVHTYENRMTECFIDEPRFQSDKAVADAYIDGPAAYIAMETGGTLEGEMQALCTQFYYGAASGVANSKGFPGLLDSYDATNMSIDAGGTTSSTASSVWMVRFEPQQVRWVMGAGGRMTFSPVRIESVFDPTDNATPPTKKFDAYVQTMLFRPGLQVGSLWSCVRIKKLTKDVGHTLNDDLLYQALELFPAGTQPNVILMTRRSLRQLRGSRTATNPTGSPAPLPRGITGLNDQDIPIRVTDSIKNTEALTL